MLFHSTKRPSQLHVIHLNKEQKNQLNQLSEVLKPTSVKKRCLKSLCCKSKEDKAVVDANEQKNVFVLDFDGDIKASAVESLREEISTVIGLAKAGDEVVLRLESGGGQVNAYGLASSQLQRLKDKGIGLTVCVDKISASGGYMMACVADKIIASDFAVIGSVGVVSQLPNFYDFLKKHDINVELFTAGEYKRTVTMFGQNDDKDRAKHQQDLEHIHELFKAFVKKHRPNLDVEKIATGEFWFGTDALRLGLVDEIGTSDAYVMSLFDDCQVFLLQMRSKPTLAEKLGLSEQLSVGIQQAVLKTGDALTQLWAKNNQP